MSEGTDADLLRLWLDAQPGAASADAGAEVWRRAEELFRSWTRLTQAFGTPSAEAAGLFDPAAWLKPEGEAGLALLSGWLGGRGGPAADPLGQGAERVSGSREWVAYAAALERHRAITGAAWMAAFREFAERARRLADDARRHGNPAPGWAELETLWREIADAEFAATQRSKPYLEAQATLLAAGLKARARLRAEVEAMAELLGLPTRAEVDDMAEAIHRLRREIRALKR